MHSLSEWRKVIKKSIHSDRYKLFREFLTSSRKKLGLTQTDLAERLRKPQSFVAKYELGERRLDVAEFIEIAAALEIDPCAVIKEISKE